MQEERAKTNESITPGKEEAEQEATSKETLSDVKESEKSSDAESGGGSSKTPSPDGQFDEPPASSGPGSETGPM